MVPVMADINQIAYLIRDMLDEYQIDPEKIEIVIRAKDDRTKWSLERNIKINWHPSWEPSAFMNSNSIMFNGVKFIISSLDVR